MMVTNMPVTVRFSLQYDVFLYDFRYICHQVRSILFSVCNNFVLNPFPNKPWFLRDCSTSLLKTLWEKEKLLVTSNFSFSHSIFYPNKGVSAIFTKFKIFVWKHVESKSVSNLSFGKESSNSKILSYRIR